MSRKDDSRAMDIDSEILKHKDKRSSSSKDRRSTSSSSKDSKSRDSRDHKDRESKDYKKPEKKKEKDREENSKKDGDAEGGGELELDIDATNRIRISLGLKPLNVESKKKEKEESEAKKAKDIEEAAKEREQIKLRAKIEKSKEDRAYRTRITGKSIAEEMEIDDAAAWVTKSRMTEQEDKQKEKELALKKLKDLDNDESKSYSSKDLAGLKVANDMSKLEDSVILTLKDTNVLKDANDLNEDDDELENIHLTESEKLNKNKELKKKKPIYNVYDTEKNKSLLAQYDDPREKEKFVIGAKGNLQSENNVNEADEIRKKLQGEFSMYNLDSEKKFANAYMTQDEMNAKFKKKTITKKTKKIRVKQESELTAEEFVTSHSMETQSTEINHGSRNANSKVKIEQQQKEAEDKEKRDKNYAKALNKAAEDSELVFNDRKVIIDEDDKEFTSLPKNRTKTREDVAKLILESNKKRDEEIIYGGSSAFVEDPALVTNSTTEFINRVQPIEEILGKPEKKKKKEKRKDKEADMTDEIEEHERMLREQLNKQKKENKIRPREQFEEVIVSEIVESDTMETDIKQEPKENEDQSESDEDEGGVAATLALIQRSGTQKMAEELDTWVGRKSDKTLEEEYIRKPGFLKGDPKFGKEVRLEYLDENGRQLTPKEAFRNLSYRFHGKQPGKNKKEKKMRHIEEEAKRKNMTSGETPLNMVEAMNSELEKSQNPYILLSGIVPESDLVLEKKASKKAKK